MVEKYNIVYEGGEGEIVEKKSRFIATVVPVKTEEEAIQFIERMKKKYWDANHNCSAYIIGKRQEIQRCSDDGEPSKTAGRPMLDVLLGEGLHDTAVVVTRYFGGTLLGTGGLVRAYGRAVKEGLCNSKIVEKNQAKKYQIKTDYNGIGKLQYIIGQMGLTALNTEYTEVVSMELLVPLEKDEAFIKKVTEASAGQVQMEELDVLYFGILDGKVLVFEE
ncbi:YigZ family protein [Velocimicrobium porci]|uniref:YigZ family protein n=1 Tax=Velocimicrobium porci TaxID=2606634 RepID=A0A6L5XXZ2_9FIRM|nr:YigZ family protein [Velocimicrobium porci]MSS63524.1 YigZ family protein [Velocimicrobium porci]